MYKQEPYLSEYIDVRAGVYFKPFYNVLADCGVRKLKSSLTDMRETYSENIYADFTQYLAEQLQEICMRTLIVEMHICKSAGKQTCVRADGSIYYNKDYRTVYVSCSCL